jgi:hypothetical protein
MGAGIESYKYRSSPVSIYFPPNVVKLEARLTPAVASEFEPNRLYVLKLTGTIRRIYHTLRISSLFPNRDDVPLWIRI